MKRGIFLVAGFLIGFLFWQISAARAEECAGAIVGDIKFAEVSYISTSSDWVRLLNMREYCVDISGLNFYDTASSKINQTATSTTIDPFGELVIGLGGRLNAESSGDCLLLSPSSTGKTCAIAAVYTREDILDCYSYGPKLSWCTHVYDSFVTTTTASTTTIVTTTETVVDTSTSTPTTTSDVAPVDYSAWTNLKLNEIVSDPTDGNEKVEIYNSGSSSVNLAGGYICDSRNTTSTCKIATGTVATGGWLSVDLETESFLNNDGDSVIFKNPNGGIIDRVDYAGDGAPEKSESLARSADGAGSWQITTNITLGAANNIVARPASPPSPSSGGGSSYNPPPVPVITATSTAPVSTTILINEIYPDPPGIDSEEFIEIYNFGASAVDLGGWKIKDKEKSYNLSSNIAAGGYLVLKREDTDIALNNTTAESVILVDAWGREADKISYERAHTGESYNRTALGWLWSATVTPGAKNVIEEEDAVGLIWKISAPESGEVGEKLKFSAVGSVDPRGGQLNFIWKFVSGTVFNGTAVEYSFATSGIYEIELIATSTAGTSGSKKLVVKIGAGLSVQNASVGITEIFPNPDGTDDAEYIEIYNFGSSTVSLAGWNLRADAKQYEIPVKTNIAPSSTLIFYRAATKIALNNSGGKVSLLTPAGEAVDLVKYDKAISGKSFSLEKNIWQWVASSPGAVATPSFQGGGEGEVVAGAILGVKISNTTVPAKSSGWYAPISISDARAKPKDAKVKVRGTVSALPGIFGSQYFYISSAEGGGIQIYQNKKNFPKLTMSDEIEVSGAVSEASGQKRVRAASAADIKILGAGKEIMPIDIGLDELDESLAGGLLKITGDITEIKSNYMYVDNGAGEVEVFFKTGAKIDKAQFKEGDKVEVVGVLENVKGDFQIWPRSSEDIKVIGAANEVKGVKISGGETPVRRWPFVLGSFGAVALGILARERKKALELAKKIFKA